MMDSTNEQRKKDIMSKGDSDFSNAIIHFTQAHSILLAYATNLNLKGIFEKSSELQTEIHSIDKISRKIKEISVKTRILSINAAIEAARAGNSGRGFAVVAEEVGTLSDQTTKCTSEVDAVNKSVLGKAKENNGSIHRVQEDLLKFSSMSEAISGEIFQIANIEENGFIITLLAKRLENHADFIRNLIKNAGTIPQIADHHNCALGKWYDANRTKYQSIPAFVNLYNTHEDFHKTADEFNKSLSVESILKLVDISHEILRKFISLISAFKKLILQDDTYFDFE